MKLTLSWLKSHLDTNASLTEICDTLTKIGLEVEGVEDQAQVLSGFTIAKIISAVQHPNADKLRLCMVDDGSNMPVQVVCGAHNAREGLVTVLASPGTYIPSKKTTLGVGEIRGVESKGMLCSAEELELSDISDGIMELPNDAPIGTKYVDYAKIGDPVIDINLTPNRSDAAGIYGIARDLAAAGLGTIKPQTLNSITTKGTCPVDVNIEFTGENRKFCPAFGLRLIKGVKNGASPAWMQSWLKSIGLRPINALVDITNFITFDHGRPLHVFDAAKILGNLNVRRAKQGESIQALDGKTYTLDESIVIIADDKGVQSIAGIMGGELSGCDENTTDVLIECALWDSTNIAQSGRKFGINSDARYRFERGVDPAITHYGIELATKLVLEICGGTPTQTRVTGDIPSITKCIIFPWSEVKRLAGLELPIEDMTRILLNLGFGVTGAGEASTIAVPSWRPDIEGKADIVEEIIRIAGIEHITNVPLRRYTAISESILTIMQRRTRRARRALAACGLVEAITYSFISKAQAGAFGGGSDSLKLANPIAADMSDMRPSLLPGLIAATQRNVDRAIRDVAMFEVGQIFQGNKPQDQKIAATGLRRGLSSKIGQGRHWSYSAKPVDIYDVKADAFALLSALNISTDSMQLVVGAPSWFHPGRSATMQFGPKGILGYFGELHPRVLQELGIDGAIMAFEIVLDNLPAQKQKLTKIKPKLELSAYQPITRDFAFIVDKATRADDLVKTARCIDRTLVSQVRLFDLYEGQGVEQGKKSLAIEVTLQPRDRTLNDSEIDEFATKLIAEITKKTGGVLRG
jgi:phenylalanyl-tRNA synthetase beta chain